MADSGPLGAPGYRESRAPYYQQVIADDPNPAPAVLREYSEVDVPVTSVPRAQYISAAYASLERERMWPRVWQLACREEQIPDEGDCHVFDSPGASLIIVRGADEEIRAFYNSCPHRGMKLCAHDTSVASITCPFHSFQWTLDGRVAHVPARWDFPGLRDEEVGLSQVRVGRWQGFVFINRDADAPALETYLGHLVPHFEEWRYDDFYLEAIMRMPIDANWKTSIEAFLEAYHLSGIHAQALPFGGDSSTQYDVWADDPHVNRFLEPTGVTSDQYLRTLDEQQILDFAIRTVFGGDGELPQLPEGGKARLFMSSGMRAEYGSAHGRDYSAISDAEAADAIQYMLFPNIIIFRSLGYPFVYRFAPDRDDPQKCRFDFMVFKPKPQDGGELPEVRIVELGKDRSFRDSGVLPPWLGLIYDQDSDGLRQCQEGMREGGDAPIRFSQYQEVRIRHLHHTLARYISDDPADAPGRNRS